MVMFCTHRSEAQSPVFIILISWLYLTLRTIPYKAWKGIWLAYDNICNIIKLRAAQEKLPLPDKFTKMWQKVIVDGLHINNHKHEHCKTALHLDNIYRMYPDLKGTRNTMAAEQTFVWLGRYKKIISSMPKLHHLFFLHRLVKRRNRYNSECYKNHRKPLLPKLRNGHSS